jgi:membrane-associated phospholipid phosphatase
MRHRAHAFTLVCCLTIGLAAPAPLGAQTPADVEVSPSASPRAATESATPSIFPLRNFFGDSIADFKRLPSWETLTILSVGGVAATIGHSFDQQATRSLSASDALGTMLHSGETVGGARTQLAGALATYTLGRVTGSAKVTAVGADLIRAQIVTQTLTAGIKMAVGRTRPDGTQYSFPSGHSSVSFATATVLQRNFGWKVGVPAYAMAGYVAASRVQVKRHFLSDVTFGAALGVVAGRAVTVGKGNTRFALAPGITPGGASLNFTLLPR